MNSLKERWHEVVTSGLLDFFLYCAMDGTYRAKHLDGTWLSGFFGTLAREALELYRLPYAKAVAASKNFDPLQRMTEVAKKRLTTLVLVTNAVKVGSSQAI